MPCRTAMMAALAACTLWSMEAAAQAIPSQDEAEAEILAYHVSLKPDLAHHSVRGSTTIDVRDGQVRSLTFPVHDLSIDQVTMSGQAHAWKIDKGELHISWLASDAHDGQLSITVSYHGQPKEGIVFDKDYVYTNWNPCNWMICRETPGTRASFDIALDVPRGWSTLSSGEPVAAAYHGSTAQRWVQKAPYASYLYGFAAGRLTKFEDKYKGQYGEESLAYYGSGESPRALRASFARTAEMLAFLEQKAGGGLPQGHYTQLLIRGSEAQELSSYSVLGHQELDVMNKDPHEDWAIVHEMAHQWWGNSLTCANWSEFWLNEGITTFIVAAYKQQRWGEAAYQHELALFRQRYQKAVDQGWDRPLSFSGEYPSLGLRRAVQYYKGALFMDALRQEIGDAAFWEGLRSYTRQHAGSSVRSSDLQQAMSAAAGKDLTPIFRQWVFGG